MVLLFATLLSAGSSTLSAQETGQTMSFPVKLFSTYDYYVPKPEETEESSQTVGASEVSDPETMKLVQAPGSDDLCPVSGMAPVEYKMGRVLTVTRDRQVVHFCSAHGLFNALLSPEEYGLNKENVDSIWFSMFPDDDGYERAENLFFVWSITFRDHMGNTGSIRWFRSRNRAERIAQKLNSEVLRFHQIQYSKFM